ncbi:MAG: FAD-dependent oxidoreductase [Candidatus Thalassarchaeaceae archaeon]|nr:FAD-dependent oxidoreductase [Candidatus Thalassarchaeaceae archaeon]
MDSDSHSTSEQIPPARLLLGNEAIVAGARAAGVGFASGYPGTPASEIGDGFAAIAQSGEVVQEYSVNEKIALEVAHAAALSGVRSITSMKHLGLNVAADPAATMPYVGVGAGLLIVSAGDPGCHTSPNEQDQRQLAKAWHMPCIDPDTPQAAHDMARDAFALSEACNLPVLMRVTTRICHARAPVRIDPPRKSGAPADFPREASRLCPLPSNARRMRGEIEGRLATAQEWAERPSFARTWSPQSQTEGEEPLLLISSGAPAWLLRDNLEQLSQNRQLPPIVLLTLGVVHPFPDAPVLDLLAGSSKLLVVEEGSPFLEEEVRLLAQMHGWEGEIHGMLDGWLPSHGELDAPTLVATLDRYFSPNKIGSEGNGRASDPQNGAITHNSGKLEVPMRPPILCAGCPHRGSYLAMRMILGPKPLCFNDIGCYTLGYGPPFDAAQSVLSMGSSLSQASVVSRLTGERTVAFVGDSTFYHAGMPGLANIVEQNDDVLVVVLDNRTTAMTGFQPSPTSEGGLSGEKGTQDLVSADDVMEEPIPLVTGLSQEQNIADVCRALGVAQVEVVEALNLPAMAAAFRNAWSSSGPTVLVATDPCPIYENRMNSSPLPLFQVDSGRCRHCAHSCASNLHCGVDIRVPYEQELVRRRQESPPPTEDLLTIPDQTPCATACPLNICIQGYVGLAAAGDFDGSLATIHQRTPFPAVLSHVCHHPCETVCVKAGSADGSIPINQIKRLTVDSVIARDGGLPPLTPVDSNGVSVAVIGAGPAGLAAAHDLAAAGYRVNLHDRDERAGGLLAHAIPPARLPRDKLEMEIKRVLDLGIAFHGGSQLGVDTSLSDLLTKNAGVILALGASKGMVPDIEGLPAAGIESALELLRRLARGEQQLESLEGLDVVVVGGGDAAIDAVRSSQLGGARSTTLVYRRRREDMPAASEEIEIAMGDGLEFISGSIVERVSTDADELHTLYLADSSLVEGTQSPKQLQCNRLFFAIGQSFDLPSELENLGLAVNSDGSLVCNHSDGHVSSSSATGSDRLFVAGDLCGGPRTVVEALASGRRAAAGLDRLLSTSGVVDEPLIQLDFLDSEGPVLHSNGSVDALGEPDDRGRQHSTVEVHTPAHQYPAELDSVALMAAAHACHFCSSCANCSACLEILDCPAIEEVNGSAHIIEDLCTGCRVCADLCPNGAIVEVTR